MLQDSVNAASGFQNCIAKIRRFLLYGLFAVAAYVIKNAVEEAFKVSVKNVNTLNTKSKRRRVGKYAGRTKTYKKAIVTLAEGSSIEI